jgi:hypothetical protein
MKSLSAADRVLQSNGILSFCESALFIFTSGKALELMYFSVLEAYFWWCYVLRIRSRLITFTPTPFLVWHPAHAPVDLPKLTAIMRPCGFSAAKTSINWEAFAEAPTGMIFGSTHERPTLLQRSEGLFSIPTDVRA